HHDRLLVDHARDPAQLVFGYPSVHSFLSGVPISMQRTPSVPPRLLPGSPTSPLSRRAARQLSRPAAAHPDKSRIFLRIFFGGRKICPLRLRWVSASIRCFLPQGLLQLVNPDVVHPRPIRDLA